MSKDFDTALSDGLDSVAHAAQSAGPAAARIRGRKRTVRRRVALSAASLVLVAASATVAFEATSSSGAGTPHVTGGSPHATASASPTTGATLSPSISPTTGASTGSSTGRSATSSPSASSPAMTGSPASSQPTSANPQQAVAAAWLSPDQMPFASTFRWVATQDTSHGGPIGQQLTPTVFYVPKDTVFQAITMCGDPSQLLARTIGAQHTDYTASTGTVSVQFIFFFADAASARQTFTWLQSQYSSSCPVAGGSTVRIMKTAGDGVTSAVWLTTKGSSGPVDLSPYNREFFVLRGSTIAYVDISSTAALPTTYDDASQLSTIAAHLCVYGGTCN